MRTGITIRDCRNPGNNHVTPKGTACEYSEKMRSWLASDPTWNDRARFPFVPSDAVLETVTA